MLTSAKHTLALLALTLLLAPTHISAQTLPAESNGTLDASFGTGGKVTTDFAGSSDGVSSVAVQPNGTIIAAGGAVIDVSGKSSDFALARYGASAARPRRSTRS
jgi:hypothetical protein